MNPVLFRINPAVAGFFNKRFPFVDRTAGANIQSWIEVLESAIKKYDSDTLFVFGNAATQTRLQVVRMN